MYNIYICLSFMFSNKNRKNMISGPDPCVVWSVLHKTGPGAGPCLSSGPSQYE